MPSKYVLMLENDSDDQYITQSALKELNISVPVRYEYWSRSLLNLVGNEKPGLILLAYNTSPENQLEILKEIKSSPAYAGTPVVVLVEDLPEDMIRKYYLAGASTVIKKPSSQSQTTNKIKVFFDYWFGVADL